MVGIIAFWRRGFVFAISVLLVCSAAAQADGVSVRPAAPLARGVDHSPRRGSSASKPSPLIAKEPQPPPAPPTPEQMPPTPPQVTYSNGLLSIVATNSTLSDILRAVSIRIGAKVDAPPYLTSERAAARIGPGTPRQVLSDLLSGSRFDYILVGADGDPNAVRNIILTANQASPSAGVAPSQRPMQAGSVTPPQEEVEEEAVEEQQSQNGPETAQPPPQPPPGERPLMRPQPPDQIGGQQPFSPEAGNQPQVKTPEQLLQELRKLQQQQQNEPER